MCGFSQKLVFLVIASLQKVKQWTTNEVTQTPNYKNVAKVEIKMKKVLRDANIFYDTIFYYSSQEMYRKSLHAIMHGCNIFLT